MAVFTRSRADRRFAARAVLTLALRIGVSSAVFSICGGSRAHAGLRRRAAQSFEHALEPADTLAQVRFANPAEAQEEAGTQPLLHGTP